MNKPIRQPAAPNVDKSVPPQASKSPITTGPGTVGIVGGKGVFTTKPTGKGASK